MKIVVMRKGKPEAAPKGKRESGENHSVWPSEYKQKLALKWVRLDENFLGRTPVTLRKLWGSSYCWHRTIVVEASFIKTCPLREKGMPRGCVLIKIFETTPFT